jgi:hypothetical protein
MRHNYALAIAVLLAGCSKTQEQRTAPADFGDPFGIRVDTGTAGGEFEMAVALKRGVEPAAYLGSFSFVFARALKACANDKFPKDGIKLRGTLQRGKFSASGPDAACFQTSLQQDLPPAQISSASKLADTEFMVELRPAGTMKEQAGK